MPESIQNISNELGIKQLNGGFNNLAFLCHIEEKKYCIKLYKDLNRAQKEWRSLTFLNNFNYDASPKPFHFTNNKYAIIIMEYIEGISYGDTDITTIHLKKLSEVLNLLYNIKPTSQTTWTVNCNGSRMYNRVIEYYQKTEVKTTIQREAHSLVSSWLNSGKEKFFTSNNIHFSHGDPSLNNLIWTKNSRCRMIDFEYSGWTEMEFDLADIIEHPQAKRINNDLWEGFINEFNLSKEGERKVSISRELVSIFWLLRFWPTTIEDKDAEKKFILQLERVFSLLSQH